MSRHPVDLRSMTDRPYHGVSRVRRSVSRHHLFLLFFLSLLLLSEVLGNGSFLVTPTYANSLARPLSTPPGFTYQQYLKQGTQHTPVKSGAPSPYPQPPKHTITVGTKPTLPPPSTEPATMTPINQPLSSSFLAGSTGTSAFDLKSSDGRLEVQVQPGILDVSQATVAGGKAPVGGLALQITQVHGHAVGMLNQLGYYQAQVVDSQGQVVNGIKLRSPVTIVYHYQPTELHGLNLNPAHILLDWPSLIATAQQAKQPTANLVIAMHDDPAAHTLTARSSVFGPGPFSLFADPQNQGDPSPHVAEMQGNNGQLTYSYPLQIAPGTGGFAPQLALDYSSMDPNDRHSSTSPANDEGDGWSLGLGSITMETYPTTPTATNWFFINGVDNVSDRLIYNSSTNLYYTEHLSYLRIQQVTANGQPCFQVWDTSGTFYELGCTTDSLEYSISGTTRYNYQWNVDRIVAPNQGSTASQYRLILATYLQDCNPASTNQPCPSTSTVRDAVLKQISYGYSSNTTTLSSATTAGTVDFTYLAPFSYAPNGGRTWATPYIYGYDGNENCTPLATTTLRCDDPIQKSGGFTPPDVMGTFSLQFINSYIGPDSGTGSYPAYDYSFNYTDTSFASCTDPLLLTSGYCAGEHLLSSITPYDCLKGTCPGRKSVSFTYTAYKNTYYDSLHQVPVGSPTQYYQNSTNWDYLTSYIDTNTGIGEKNITYQTAYSNTDGTPTIKVGGNITDDRYDALYCSSNATNPNTSLQCFQGNYLHPDDHAWSVQVVTSRTASGEDSSSLSAATTTYNYYRLAYTGAYVSGAWCQPDQYGQEAVCVGDNWLPNSDSDWQDYYHAEFRGFNQVWQLSPANDLTVDYYFSTEGWYQPATDPADYDAGHLLEEDRYQGGSYNASALLQKTVNTYPGPYPNTSPGNNTSNPSACYTPSGSSPYAACDVMILSSTTTDLEGNSSGPSVTTNYTYDDYNPNTGGGLQAGYHNLTQEQISTSNSNAPTVTHKWAYSDDDQYLNGWNYYVVNKATHSETDSGGHIYQCQDITYDEGGPSTLTVPVAGWPTTVSTYSNANCITPRGAAVSTTYTGYDAFGNPVATVDGVATSPGNSSIYNTNGCTLTTNPYVMSHAWTTSESRYTSCVTYDAYNAQPTIPANAFGQSTTTTFDYTQEALPTLLVDANNQQTSASYSIDSNGNETVQAQLPLYTGSYTTQSKTNSGCTSTSALPCYEVDTISNQYNTVTARTFYDSQGRAVEKRTPGPTNGYDTVVFTTYNDAQHSTFQSLPFVVTDGSGWIDPNGAKDYNNNTPGGTGTYFDALGRVLAIKDPNFGQTQPPDQEPGLACPAPLSATYTDCTNYSLGTVSGDSNTYSVVTAIDPNGHATVSYLDPLGRTTYAQVESGKFGGTFTANELKTIAYNILNEPTSVVVTDKATQSGQTVTSATTTASYDDLGRLTGINDPDRGNQTYSYDADGQMITDVSGSRTIGYVYDLLGRVGCVQNMTPTESATGACTSGATQYVKNTYDTTTLGTQGTTDFPVGRLTKSVATTHYPDSSYAQVSELYQHDKRGRLIDEQISFPNLPGSWNVTTALPSYKMQSTYNDADQVTTTTTSTNPAGQGYTTTQVYDTTTGGLTGLSDTGSGPADLATLSFNAQAQVSSINYLTSTSSALAVDQFGYDANLRPITDTANWQSGSGNGTAALFSQSRSFDPASNLTSLTTTQAAVPGATGSGGSETSNFCYDEQNRLVWAGNSGTQPGAGNGTCGSATLSSSLSGASYSDSYLYTHLGQLYQGPLNGGSAQEQYLYCNTSTPHQLVGLYPTSSGATCSNYTGKSADYSSSYDSWGNVTSRSTSGTTGTLSYDLLDHLTKWFVSATNQEQYVYDASGNRILRRSTTSSSTTMTVYAFGREEHVYTGSGTNQWNTYYYSLSGRLIGAKDANGTVFYMTDTLGSILDSFTNAAGGASLKGNQVFGPYGNARYFKGSINTAKGFTGQYNDSLTGLDYYGARYYDPVAGMFLSADPVGNGSGNNPYAYVDGNPETFNDPTGQFREPPGFGGGVGTLDPQVETGSGSGDSSNTSDAGNGGNVSGSSGSSSSGNSLSWSVTTGNTVTQYSIDPNTGDTIYWVYQGGFLVAGGDIPDTGGSPIAANGAVLAAHGIKLPSTNSVPGGFSVNVAPQPMPPIPQAGSGSSGSGGRSLGRPIAPPPGPNNPNGSGGIVTVRLSRSRYPETCGHIEDAINNGQPSVLTKDTDPIRKNLRRKAALNGYPTLPNLDRDEYPMAMTLEGGAGADIRYINFRDNRGAGSSVGSQLDPYPEGTQFTIECV